VSILENRTTPLKCGKSPSQLLMSKWQRTVLPINSEQLMPQKTDIKDVRMKLQQEHKVQKKYYDRQSKDNRWHSQSTIWQNNGKKGQ
jgi:hypothetical protein